MPRDSMPRPASSSRVTSTRWWRRIVTLGCGTTSRIAASREPSGSCMFSSGWAGEKARSTPP